MNDPTLNPFSQAKNSDVEGVSHPGDADGPEVRNGQGTAPLAPTPYGDCVAFGSGSVLPSFPRPFGNYELLGEVARGGMGVVYRARQISLGRIVALKSILAAHVASPEAIRRFYQEAQAAAALDHPGIVAIYEVGECDGEHFFTMAFVEGMTLTSRVKNGGPLAPQEAARLVQGIAEAVYYANERGILHRDLKPDNVMLDSAGRARVTDFGLAKQLDGREQGLTITGQVIGTPAYMSPEQALGKRDIGPPSDLYSVGGILYFLLTGKSPFRGNSITEVLCKVVQERPTPPREFAPNVPATLEAVCLKCLEKAPGDRYADCAQLAKALAEFAGGSTAISRLTHPAAMPAPAPPPPTATLSPRVRQVSPMWIVGVVGAIAIGLACAIAFRSAPAKDSMTGTDDREQMVPPKIEGQKAAILDDVKNHEPATPRSMDFGLRVDFVGTSEPVDGVLSLKEGQIFRIRIQSTRRAYVGVWTVDPQGNILQLLPSDEEPDNFFQANTPRLVPSEGFETLLPASPGIEQVHVIAATKPWDMAKGQKDGPYAAFRNARDRDGWKRTLATLRGLKVRPGATSQVSERVFPYRVSP